MNALPKVFELLPAIVIALLIGAAMFVVIKPWLPLWDRSIVPHLKYSLDDDERPLEIASCLEAKDGTPLFHGERITFDWGRMETTAECYANGRLLSMNTGAIMGTPSRRPSLHQLLRPLLPQVEVELDAAFKFKKATSTQMSSTGKRVLHGDTVEIDSRLDAVKVTTYESAEFQRSITMLQSR